jgi:hypothetical protein
MRTITRNAVRVLVGGTLALLTCVTPSDALELMTSPSDTAAPPSRPYRVTLKDGSELVCDVLSQTADSLVIRTGTNLTLALSRLQISDLQELSGRFVDGEYRRPDPNGSRLFFGPTGRPVHGGYLAAYEIFFPFLSVGIADIVTLSGGVTLFPGVTEQLFYIAPKITFPFGSENFNLAAGVLYTNITGGDAEGAGIAYGVTTVGSRDVSVTVGLGLGFAGGEFAQNPILMIGGEARLSNSVALISENWIPTGADVQLISLGFRFFGDHLSADLGLVHPVTDTTTKGFPFFPWLGFCYNFGGGN